MLRRIFAASAASAVLLTGLVGCSASNTSRSLDQCASPLSPGMLSNSVTLDSLTDGVPSVTVTGGTDIVNAQRTMLQTSDEHSLITGGEIVNATITVFDGETGDMVLPTQSRFLEAMPDNVQEQFSEFISSGETDSLSYTDLVMAGIVCSAPGDVLAIAATPGQALTSGYTEDALVIIVEVNSAGQMWAEGTVRSLPWGFPALTQDDTGRPGIVLPPQDAPSQQKVAVGIEGKGAKLEADDVAIGNVLTVGWNDNAVRSNSWTSGLVQIGSESDTQYSFREALTGIPIGSRVVILDPNDGDPQVHIVDILSAD